MTKRTASFAAIAAALFFTACEPSPQLMTDAPPPPPSTTCNAETTGKWRPEGGPSFTYEAITRGATCANAVVTLVVRSEAGEPELVWASTTRDLFGLYDVQTGDAMPKALDAWLDQSMGSPEKTGNLPEWVDGQTLPGGEFPFHPEEWIDRDAYAALRTENIPVFAFTQGRESMAVFIVREGRLESIGLQQFPG